MPQNLSGLAQSRIWWISLATLCLILEGIALYYQYALQYLPCVLCIHVRMLLALLFVVALIALFSNKLRATATALLGVTALTWFWLTERSYQLLATERGWSIDECSMESGLPSWLALEQWFPWLFHIHEPCGYTPYVFMKVSMAEVLLGLSIVMSVICAAGFVMGLRMKQQST